MKRLRSPTDFPTRCSATLFQRLSLVAVAFLWTSVVCAAPQAADDAPTPLLRHDPGGPDSVVKALQFAPDGQTLYVAGWNKVIQVYKTDDAAQNFRYEPRLNYRVPVGPGRFGMVEAMALSADGRHLAASGPGWAKSMDSLLKVGYVWPRSAVDDTVWNQVGTIYLYDTDSRECRALRGHRGDVRQLTFAEDDADGGTPRLVSVGFEYEGEKISQSVRAWSVADGTPIGEPLMLPNSNIPPRIRSWNDGQNRLQVAVSISDFTASGVTSELKVWSPSRSAAARVLPSSPGLFALELAGTGTSRRLFTGSTGTASLYDVGTSGRNARQTINGLQPSATPFAAARLLSSSAAAPRVAFISIQPGQQGSLEYWLHIAENGRTRTIGRLWTNTREPGEASARLREPVLVASADGRLLAAAGFQDNDVRIYRQADLQRAAGRGDIAPGQILTSENVVPAFAAFAKNGDTLGIAVGLTDSARAAATVSGGRPLPNGTLILDPAARTLQENSAGWTADVAAPGTLSSRVSEDGSKVVVTGGSSPSPRTIQVPDAFRAPDVPSEVTAHTLCPASGQNPPLVIVATHIQGEPFLNVFRADTGDFLRELTGHVRRISHLSCSADGDMLLSASLDGTVCGWLLDDLHNTTIGSVGWLNSMQVALRDGRLLVEKVQPGTPAATAGIQQDDVVVGLVRDGEVTSFEKPAQFYLQISRTPPAVQTSVVLRLSRAGREFDVRLPVSQGADVREPLFSILLHDTPRGQANAARNWLVWSPLGQFDVSGPELEQRLGWHLNTGDDAEPVTYSSIDQYREQFFQEGLLQRLLSGDHVALRVADPPPILLSLLGDEGQVTVPNYDNDLVIRQAGGSLLLEFPDDAGRMVRSAEWSLTDGAAAKFAPVRGDLWEARIDGEHVRRGSHFMNISLQTADQPPREISRRFGLRYQPAAPELKLVSPGHNIGTVSDPVLPLQASVRFAVPGRVTLTHEFGDAQTAEQSADFDASSDFTTVVTLQPGRNVLKLNARNSEIPDDLADFAFLEESTIEVAVNYAPVEAPAITIDSVETTAAGRAADLSGGSLTVDHANVTVNASIAGAQPLTEVLLTLDGQQTVPDGFQPGSAREFSIRQPLQLKPGNQRLTLSASAGGEPAQLDLDVQFRPVLPSVTVLSPAAQRTTLDALRDDHSLRFEARLDGADEHPFDFEVVVDDQPVDDGVITYDAATGMLTGNLTVVPDATNDADEHRVELRLKNAWQRQAVHPLVVEFRHPPELLQADVRRIEDSALANVICSVRTDKSRPVMAMEVSVNGDRVPLNDFAIVADDPTRPQIRLADVPLREGPNEIQIVAISRDGRSDSLTVKEIVPPPPKPAVVRLSQQVGQVTSPQLPVVFTVESETPLQRVDLVLRQDRGPEQRTSLLAQVPENERAATVRTFRHELLLAPGTSTVQVEVQNRGGLSGSSFAVSYVMPPVSVQLTRLEPLNQRGAAEVPRLVRGQVVFEKPVEFGRGILHGFVSWSPVAKPAAEDWTVRVWVNGFLRTTTAAFNAKSRRAEFQIPVVLSQKSNRIRVEAAVRDLNQPISDSNLALLENIRVASTRPETRQRLHLVLMGLQMEGDQNVASAEQLRDLADQALLLQAPESAFQKIELYRTLTGDSALGRNLKTVMWDVERELRQQRDADEQNDVVMFYYRGREHHLDRDDGDDFVLEDFANRAIVNNPEKRDAAFADTQSITGRYLSGLFKRLPGAHIVFLDVEDPQPVIQVAGVYGHDWPNFPNLGLFRVLYSGRQPGIENPPGPLLTAVRKATTEPNEDGVVALGTMARVIETYFENSKSTIVDTVIPEDLTSLALARLAAGQSSGR